MSGECDECGRHTLECICMKNISKEEYLAAVTLGVKEAILTMTESGDGYTGTIIREPFLEAIKDGVQAAVDLNWPSRTKIEDLIYAGVRNAQ